MNHCVKAPDRLQCLPRQAYMLVVDTDSKQLLALGARMAERSQELIRESQRRLEQTKRDLDRQKTEIDRSHEGLYNLRSDPWPAWKAKPWPVGVRC
jgi:hypothetical protein